MQDGRYLTEEEYVIQSYKNNFEKKIEGKIVIYGIGKNTKIILDNFDNAKIIGLMDECRAGEEIYGKRIITMDEVLKEGVKCIIIVARASNVNIIYRRIERQCQKNKINVYDINGNLLEHKNLEVNDYSKYDKINSAEIKRKIDMVDVISFDIFDTLIMRDLLYPKDIFNILDRVEGPDFHLKRVKTENTLYSQGLNPTLYEIYQRLAEGCSLDEELEVEKKHIICRKSMCQALEYARKQGKEIFFTSDMYMTASMLKEVLEGVGIQAEEDHIYVSCEHGTSKANGLFKILRKKVGQRKILHIGDNEEADIKGATRDGIDEVFYVPSALKMLEDSYAKFILKYDDVLENRICIGKMVSEVFNDPFLFSKTKGKMYIDQVELIGSIFVAPFVYRFYGWMLDKAFVHNIEDILLSSRDGWILYKIYNAFGERKYKQPKMHYFYISRSVAVLASLFNEDDVIRAGQLAFNGNVIEMMKTRFFLEDCDIKKMNYSSDEECIRLHKDVILEKSACLREKIKKYIMSKGDGWGNKVGFFDFVSSGTCQKGLKKITDFELIGLYVAHVNYSVHGMTEINVESMVDQTTYNIFQRGYNIFDNYFLLENIITSNEPTVVDFSDDGKPVLGVENRTVQQLEDLDKIQEAILKYASTIDMMPSDIAKTDIKFVDDMYGLLSDKYCIIATDYFRNQQLEDSFCNRKFKINVNE